MRVAVIGAGAVGCYYGGMLARAGHEVAFVGRPAHVDAINARGLLFETRAFTEYVKASATTDAHTLPPPDLALVCVKSGDTAEAGRALASRLAPHTIALCLQNGVDNAERLGAVIGRAALAAVVYVGAEMAGPGHVKHNGRGELVIGASAASANLARMLIEAGVPTEVSADIDAALWTKLIVNCAYNALSAIAQIAYGPLLEVDGARELMSAAVVECLAVARACGIRLPDDLLASTLALAQTMPAQTSSTAQDLARGKPTEIDFLNGYVVRKGTEKGVATPVNRALQTMVHIAEKARTLGDNKSV